MPESEQIITTVGGATYCEPCYKDLRSPYDDDFDMYRSSVSADGRCQCCELEVVAGVLVDNATASR